MSIIKKRYRVFKLVPLSFTLLLVVFFTVACEKQYIDFGSNFIDNTITNLVLVDSLTVQVSTVYVDSFVTSNTNTIFAGRFKDNKFGTVSSQSFLQIGLPASTTYDIPNGSSFDSLEIILKLNKSYYGDTLSSYNINVYQLIEPITYPSTQQYAFYNLNTRAYNSQSLGSKQLVVSPRVTDTISIKLSAALGQDLFNKMQSKDPSSQTIGEFLAYFKGLAIAGGSNNNLILGFNDSLKMRMHYNKPSVYQDNSYIDFGINQVNYQFNNITVDRSATAIAALGPNNKELLSTATNNAGFGQYITGSVVKIRFPYLQNIYQLPNFIKIIRAQLVIKPIQTSYQDPYTLPPILHLAATDLNNQIGPFLSGNSASAVQTGNLVVDNLDGLQTAYTYDVTSYLQSQLLLTTNNVDGLLVLPPNQAAIFNRVLIANGANATYKTQVNIYYASVK